VLHPNADLPAPLILVTGASGAIGPAVVEALLAAGHDVRTLARQVDDTRYSRGVETRAGDISDPGAVTSAVHGVVGVVHLAARLHLAGPPSRDIDAYRRVNVNGTASVVNAAIAAGVRRVVFASTIAVYGSSLTETESERSPARPDTPYAETKFQAEEIIRNARTSDGRAIGVVLRLAAVYGSRIKGNYRSLVKALARHRFLPIGDGTSRRTLVHDHDVGRAIVRALEHPAAAGRTYNVTDGGVHTTDEIVAAICRALGRPVPRWHVPAPFAFGAATVFDELHRLTGRGAGVLRDRLKRYVENVAIDGSAIQRELLFVPDYPLERGWQVVVDEMRSRGELR
jgi:UDP-glucose 4-epimerase